MRPVGVVRFLGTNCDRDIFKAVEDVGLKAEWCWYKDEVDIDNYSGFIIPGGFSFGDHLRTGAFAAKTPIMKSVVKAAKKGMPILGICNGFQILCESGLLPGALIKNKSQKFIDKWVELVPQSEGSYWFVDKSTRFPVAHGDGQYFIDSEGLEELRANNQIWLRYTNNPNGSVADIAGLYNKNKNVAGLMPHPERAMSQWMGGTDGKLFFENFKKSLI